MLLEGSFGAIPEKAKKAVTRIFESSNHLVMMITDFLTLSRIERGKMEYNFQKLNFKELVSNIMEEFKAMNIREKKGLDLSLEIAEEKDYTLTIDSDKMRQVIYNIIENAMKYTAKGFIKVLLCKTPDKSRVVLKVQDSGIGINKESLNEIFQKFTQASEHIDVNISGVGLGLYVAQEIIKAHQGRIWADSEGQGKGSTFYIELPC
jgi:signal transduction histidine kinase